MPDVLLPISKRMSRKRKNKNRITSKDIRSRGVVSFSSQKHHEEISEEDKQLFLDAVDSLKGSHGNDLLMQKFDFEDKQLFLDAVDSLKGFQSDDLRMEKFDFFETRPVIRHKKKSSLRKSGEQIETTLDLHGSTRTEAIVRIEQFCRLSVQRGILTITVITGRGIHSQNRKSVLKQEIIRWLNSENGHKLVDSYRQGLPHQGGEGVLILYLRRLAKIS